MLPWQGVHEGVSQVRQGRTVHDVPTDNYVMISCGALVATCDTGGVPVLRGRSCLSFLTRPLRSHQKTTKVRQAVMLAVEVWVY
jgi:hypothetical protein